MADAMTLPPPPIRETPKLQTTRRGFAASSFCLGLWGTLVFWWYPFGLTIASTALVAGIVSVVMGWRAGQNGFHLAWLGIFFGATGQGLAITSYRFMQLAFEGTPPPVLQAVWPF